MTALRVEVYDYVVAETLQDLYTILVHIVGLGIVHEQTEALMLVVVQMNFTVVTVSCKLDMVNNVNQVFQVVVMQVVNL